MSKKNQHLTEVDDLLHVVVKNALEGGACLTGHESNYSAQNSCSYRYQAVEFSRGDPERKGLYDKPIVVSSGFIPTSQYPTNAGGVYPGAEHYGDRLPIPQEGDWYVGGPTMPGALDSIGNPIPVGQNFTTSFWPYWNNAHHMIPKDTLNSEIVKRVSDVDTRKFVWAGLYKAKYNVNHFKNMILLPQDKEVGCLLKLPRHLSLDEGSAEYDPKPKFDHTEYNMKVRLRLGSIIDDYKDEADKVRKQNQDCDVTKMTTLSKDRLEDLSGDCYASIKEFGEASPGEPLVDLLNLRMTT